MKRIVIGLLALAASVTLSAAQEVPAGYPASYADLLSQAKTEGKVVIYSNMSATQWKPFIEMAAKTYPWLAVETTDSGDDMWEKYYAESNSAADTADVMLTNSVDRWPTFVERGDVADYESPEKASLPDWSVVSPGLYTASVDPTILVYNRPLSEAYKIPASRKDILELATAHPELKTRITTIDPAGNSLALGAFWTLTKARPEEWALIEQVGPYLRPERSAGSVRDKVTTGEYVFALMSSGAGIPQYERPEVKAIVGWAFPADGVPISMRNVAVTKAAKHPAAARVFLDLLLSKPGQIALAEGGQTPYRDDIAKGEAPYETYASIRDAVGEKNLIMIKPDGALAGEREAFLARWEKAIGQ